MRIIDRFICNRKYSALELTKDDCEDICKIEMHLNADTVCISIECASILFLFHSIENLILTSGLSSPSSLKGIYSQHSIKSLVIDYDNEDADDLYQIDVSRFPNLQYVFARNSQNIQGVSLSDSLRTLSIGYYSNKDLSMIQGSKLDTLQILRGKVRLLDGIEQMPLKVLSISNTPITGINCIKQLENLRFLEIENCPKIADMQTLESDSLEYLILLGAQSIDNLSFIANLPRLLRIRLEWTIKSGDLSILDELETAVIFSNKKTYNRKNKDLPKAKTSYNIDSIPKWRYILSDRIL